jgi:hypothetical protein
MGGCGKWGGGRVGGQIGDVRDVERMDILIRKTSIFPRGTAIARTRHSRGDLSMSSQKANIEVEAIFSILSRQFNLQPPQSQCQSHAQAPCGPRSLVLLPFPCSLCMIQQPPIPLPIPNPPSPFSLPTRKRSRSGGNKQANR